jgi:hypothetical protein
LHPISVLLILCAGVLIVGGTYKAIADSYTVHAVIPAPPLTQGATITSPLSGAKLSSARIAVSGTCPADSYVKAYDNNIFAGVALCTSNSFRITMTTFEGANVLRVQDFNITDQAGPSSPTIPVSYQPPQSSGGNGGSQSPNQPSITPNNPASNTTSTTPESGSGGSSSGSTSTSPPPLLLLADFRYQTFLTNSLFKWSLDLEGGRPPYTVNINWGDGRTSVRHFATDPVFLIRHVYDRQGYYAIEINSDDANGNSRNIQLAALIKLPGAGGIFSTANTTTPAKPSSALANFFKHFPRWLLVAWPSYAIVLLMLVSFWLGEREGYLHIFKRRRPARRLSHH